MKLRVKKLEGLLNYFKTKIQQSSLFDHLEILDQQFFVVTTK